MKNLKLELFNFRKNLSVEDVQVSSILEGHINACNNLSEKQVILSLNGQLKQYTFDKSVKTLLESLNDDVKEYQLLYELKHLYNVLDSKNQGELYRQPINVLLQTINSVKTLKDQSFSVIIPELQISTQNVIIKIFSLLLKLIYLIIPRKLFKGIINI